MNVNKFVGKIPEICHLTEVEQKAILERARYEAFVNLGLSNRAAAYLIMCLALGFMIVALPILWVGFPKVIGFIFFIVGLLFANLTYQKLYYRLLMAGLKNVLARQKNNPTDQFMHFAPWVCKWLFS